MNCGEKIARLRKQNNMTQAELGDALNVTYQAVSKWERSESFPDFETISRISKLFKVPISYFEEGGESQVNDTYASSAQDTQSATEAQANTQDAQAETASATATKDIIGMCVNCGKVLREGEAATTGPRLICNDCVEREIQAMEQARLEEQRQKDAQEQAELRGIHYEKSKLKKKRNIALLVSLIPTFAVFVTFLVLSLLPQNKSESTVYFGAGCVLAVLAYTFTSQMIWDGTVREVCTGGGHLISLPGVIFSFTPDGIIFLIVTKIVLFFVAAIVFVGSIVFCIFASIVISPFTFIPSLLWQNHNINKVGKEKLKRKKSLS